MADRPDESSPGSATPAHPPRADHHLRASDQDREAVVKRLGAAMNEGRLSLAEYDERMTTAYRAVTYGELATLLSDLPPPNPSSAPAAAARPAARVRPVAEPGVLAGLPTSLKVLWTILLSAVLVNLVVWASVVLGTHQLIYFWPIWVAGPAGAALLGVSAGATAIRRSRRSRRDSNSPPPG